MTDKQTINRRQFLSKLTSTVGGSVTLVAASSLVQAQASVLPDVSDKTPVASSKGYQRTEHVDTYYQLADF